MEVPTAWKRANPLGLLFIMAGTTQSGPANLGKLINEIIIFTAGIDFLFRKGSCFLREGSERIIGVLSLIFLVCCTAAFKGNAQTPVEKPGERILPPAYNDKMVRAPQPDELADFFSYQTITFRSKDDLLITANLYEIGSDNPVILLCHQANYNKYEYADIAPKLNALGYNVLAIDQRSGGMLAGNRNETLQMAKASGVSNTGFLDAEQDIVAAVEFLADRYQQKVMVWGSSYSSALALFVAVHPEVKAVLAFSPGNYFRNKKPDLKTFIHQVKKPIFITSSREEAEELIHTLAKSMDGKYQIQFIPKSSGYHGSKALWEGQEGAEEYWAAVLQFLLNIQ